MKSIKVAIIILVVLSVFRFDFWNWDNSHLIGGFLPITLAYQIGISVLASLSWLIYLLFFHSKDKD